MIRMRRLGWLGFVTLAVGLAMGGCAARPVNPSFAINANDAKQAIAAMQDSPRGLDRPVVVMAGWADPGFVSSYWVKQLQGIGVSPNEVLGFKFIFKGDFERCRDYVIQAVQAAWPSDDPAWTSEVDVVAFSMGGLVSRYCASPSLAGEAKRRLKIRNLYTISSPHLGASMAWVPTLDQRVIDMRAGSDFLVYLDEQLPNAGYTLTSYTRLQDPIVGSARTAPAGMNPWWVDNPPLHRSHQEAYRDPRIRADILRRLRGESPLTRAPAAPLPD